MKTAIFIFLNLISLVSLSQGRPGKFTITGSIFVSKYSFPEADTGSIILYVGRSFPDKVYNEAEKITVPLDKNYQFKCSIESVQFATWFSIQLPEYAKQTSRGYYYIEPGDSINLLITSTSEKKIKYDFTGKGAEKYVYKFQSDYLVSQYENTPGAGLIELRQ